MYLCDFYISVPALAVSCSAYCEIKIMKQVKILVMCFFSKYINETFQQTNITKQRIKTK